MSRFLELAFCGLCTGATLAALSQPVQPREVIIVREVNSKGGKEMMVGERVGARAGDNNAWVGGVPSLQHLAR